MKKRRRERKRSEPMANGSSVVSPTTLEGEPMRRVTTATAYRFTHGDCEVIPVIQGQVADLRKAGCLVWIDIQGTANAELYQEFGRVYDLHPLAVEDSMNLHQRAKVESYPTHGFFVARMVHYDKAVVLEQLAMFIGPDFVITTQEGIEDGDPFDRLRRHLRAGTLRPPIISTEMLAHALIDAVVDEFFPVLDAFGESLEELEDEVIAGRRDVLPRIQAARHDVVTLRKALWPLRDALFSLGREGLVFGSDVKLYLRDTTDHVLRVLEIAEGYRDTVSSLIELHLSTMSQRMNETMRFLAVISTVFIPLTFIAGVYGMNFDTKASDLNMPELASPIGYPVVMLAMLAVGVGLLWYFKRRGWLGSD